MKNFKDLLIWQKSIELVIFVKDFRQFISIARGSCAELETQGVIAYKLGYITNDDYRLLVSKVEETAKMLSSFYSKL